SSSLRPHSSPTLSLNHIALARRPSPLGPLSRSCSFSHRRRWPPSPTAAASMPHPPPAGTLAPAAAVLLALAPPPSSSLRSTPASTRRRLGPPPCHRRPRLQLPSRCHPHQPRAGGPWTPRPPWWWGAISSTSARMPDLHARVAASPSASIPVRRQHATYPGMEEVPGSSPPRRRDLRTVKRSTIGGNIKSRDPWRLYHSSMVCSGCCCGSRVQTSDAWLIHGGSEANL
ncbi:unnamed protein product, partial [Urochloa humidicola]